MKLPEEMWAVIAFGVIGALLALGIANTPYPTDYSDWKEVSLHENP